MVEYYLSGVSILLVSVVGVCLNIVSGLVLKFRQRDINQTLRDLLVFLALVNSVFLVLVVMVFSLPQFSSSYSSNVLPYIVPTVLPCTSGAMTGAIPWCVFLSCSIILYREGKGGNNIVLCVAIIQLACHAPRTTIDISDIYQSYHNINYYINHTILVDISHLLLTISASITVCIFTIQVCIINQVRSFLSLLFRDIISVK